MATEKTEREKKIEMGFDVREIPEIIRDTSKIYQMQSKQKRDYGNKYMENKTTISIDKTIFDDLVNIQDKKGFKTKGELMRYFVDVEKVFSPKTEIVFKCKDCGEIVDIPPNINVDKFRHRDLCKDNQCKGSFTTDFKIKIEQNASKSDANDKKDDKSDATEQKSDAIEDVTDIKVRESDKMLSF